jgi:ATP-dependent DNA helicase RecQ
VARKFLSAVYRTGQSFGVGHLETVLTGMPDEKAIKFGHDRLSVFGIVKGKDAALIKPVARALLLRDALRPNEHGGLMFGPEAKAILKGDAQVSLIVPPKSERRARRMGSAAATGSSPTSDPLFEALRACRRTLAAETGVPPYVIFHDSTLREMAQIRPKSLRDMALVTGVGSRKLDAYGAAFLAAITAHLSGR